MEASEPAQAYATDGLEITADIFYGAKRRQSLDVVRPVGAPANAPIVVYFHGGGWLTGRKSLFTYVAAALAPHGVVTVLPSYRLHPRVTFPDFLHDCASAVAWVQAHPEQTGAGPIFLMGHSAGGYNAMMLGLDRSWLHHAGADPDALSGVIGLAGLYDFLPITDAKRLPIFNESPGPETQPITFARADAPPLLLITGDQDREVRSNQAEALAAKMQAIGGSAQRQVLAGVNHIELIRGFRPDSPVLKAVVAFIAKITTP